MKISLTIAIVSPLLICSCSGFDFLGYANNTGLYAIPRPEGYESAKLGIEMAPTSTADFDLLGVSGGLGTGTLLYKLAANGKLSNVSDPWDSYLGDDSDSKRRETTGTGVSLAGLPSWGGRESGCVAIGEPNEKQVVLRCESDPGKNKIIRLAGGDQSEFGHRIAAVHPENGGPWLLAVAARRHIWVISDELDEESNRTDAFIAETAGGQPVGNVENLTAGRLGPRFYVAALVAVPNIDSRVYIFVQDPGNGKKVNQTLCIEPPEDVGFSGTMVTGDIDGDGADELVVAAGLGQVGKKKVYVYDVADLISGAGLPGTATCTGGIPTPQVILEPEEGDFDVNCGDACHFGGALAVGDISTEDSHPEIIVGAPEAGVDGTKEAGAVYIYTVTDWALGEAELASQVVHSSPSQGHWFGGGLAVTPVAGRNELVVATTGKGNLYVAFCTGVGEDINSGADVPTNRGGSVVSTRCRQ